MSRLPLFLLTIGVAAAAACAAPEPDPGPAKAYEGRWNYDLPDTAAMTNIAAMNIGNGLLGPQIGDIVFTAVGRDRVIGRTDVGCTWKFAVDGAALRLESPGQTCHNPTAGYAYTMTEWTVRVDGDHETESIRARSHHGDRDYDFELAQGHRTRAPEDDPAAVAAFTGTWSFGAPNPRTGANTRIAAGAVTPETGTVEVRPDYGNRMTATTGEGCQWSLVARGNTAKLDPPIQTCTIGASAVTLRYWTIAGDGRRQVSQMYGTDRAGVPFIVNGELQ
ncbi:hypothetical protein [Nocardia sp. NPDC048505]|uniref:hypothetical protein n=1 Tax=unclassified Nocardia TaxID=2637762 RepID=UPI0033DF5385